jgi:hypothetical protein
MEPINCYTCGAVILTYELGQTVPSYVVVAPGAPVPGGNHVVHICPQQPTYELQRRPSAVLDWTDEQERAAVRRSFPQWKLHDSDVIFCMTWYDPGWRLGAAPSAAQAVEVYNQAVVEAEEEAAAAEAHAEEHPDDEHLQDIANIARSSVWLVKDQADRAAATADALANG